MMTATPQASERAFALQKYLLLHSQHEALQKHLAQISTTADSSSASSSTSASRSPSRSRSRFPSISSSPGSPGSPDDDDDGGLFTPAEPSDPRRGSVPRAHVGRRPPRRSSLPTVVDAEEHKLRDVNLQIKKTLTELLNCASVRRDQRSRLWVQTRLMDAERELKGSRARSCERRRSEDVGAR